MKTWGHGVVVGLAAVMAMAACAPTVRQTAVTKASPPTAAVAKFVLRVNAGTAEAYTDKAGNVWQGEKMYNKGGGFGFTEGLTIDRGATMKIEGTNDARIYQTERYQMKGFTAEVPNGKYTVRLHFAETYDGITQAGMRIFDVTIQGKPVLQEFDVFKEANGPQKALVKEFKGIQVGSGVLEIGFVAKTQNVEINGIEILSE